MEDRVIKDLQELVASVETCTGNPQVLIYPVKHWLERIKAHPDEFCLDREYGLIWHGLQVWTCGNESGRYLIKKWKEYSTK